MVAPYAAATNSATTTCRRHAVVSSCQASSSADRRTGILSVSDKADSGLDGAFPDQVASGSFAELTPTVDMGNATAATYTFHIDVTRFVQKDTQAGASDLYLWAAAACSQCSDASGAYDYLYGTGEQTLAVTLLRGNGGTGSVLLGLNGDANVECDDFCLTARGTSLASVQAVVTGVDVTRWGLGSPIRPTIQSPAPDSTIAPSTYVTNCQTGCQQMTGEQLTGSAEPGMPVVVSQGGKGISRVITDGTGTWTSNVTLAPGCYAVTAAAISSSDVATAPARSFCVSAG